MARVGGRGPLLWLDRWHPPHDRRREILDSLHATPPAQHMEQREHEARRGTHEAGTHAPGGTPRLCRARSQTLGHLLLRAAAKGSNACPEYKARLRANAKAWAFFQSQPPYYQRMAGLYVMSAKKDETRLRRPARLIDDSVKGRRIGIMERSKDR